MQLSRVATAALLGAAIALAPAASASAAGVIELSDDGVNWSASLGAPLFAVEPKLVPQQDASSTFWVRNSAADDAYLRLTVENLSWSGTEYANALSVAGSVPSKAGAPIVVGSSSGCLVLLEGVMLAAGQSIEVTTTLALGDLVGTAGQTGTAAMDIAVGLEQAVGAPRAACNPAATPDSTVVVVPRPRAASKPAAVPTAPETPADSGPIAIEVPPLVPGTPLLTVLANTLVSIDSSILGWAFAGVPLGAAVYLLVGVSRRRLHGSEGEQL